MSTDRGPDHHLVVDDPVEPRQATRTFPEDYTREQMLRDMEAARDLVNQRVYEAATVPPGPLTPEQQERLRQAVRGITAFGEQVTPLLRAVGENVMAAARSLDDFLVSAGLHPERPPADPKARALWLRQHRNTGPARGPVNQRRRHP